MSDPGAPICDPAVFELGRAGAWHLLRHAADGTHARRHGCTGRAARVRPRDVSGWRPQGAPAVLFADVPDEIRVWASHGDFVAAPPSGFSVVATSANAPVAAMADPKRRNLYALLFHPEVVHTESGLEIIRNFAFKVCGCTGDWTMKSFVAGVDSADPSAGRRRSRRLRAERRRRLDGGRAAAAQGHRRSPHLHLRRQRRAAPRRGAQIRKRFERLHLPLVFADATRSVPRSSGRRHRSRAEAEDHRQHVHRRVRGGGAQAGTGRLPRPGHAVSGCDRIGVGGRPVGDDQEPSQRRRPARAHADEAGRAAARTVQGRSPRRRPRTRTRTRSSWCASRSPDRAWRCASSAR